MKVIVINGPNLNLQGIREPEIYGNLTFEEYIEATQKIFPQVELSYFQSNIEGEIIDKLHSVGFDFQGIVLNAGAYTHTSIAIGDAVAAIKTPVVEVHISNLTKREEFRWNSFIAAHAKGQIIGFGLKGYQLAIQSFL